MMRMGFLLSLVPLRFLYGSFLLSLQEDIVIYVYMFMVKYTLYKLLCDIIEINQTTYSLLLLVCLHVWQN